MNFKEDYPSLMKYWDYEKNLINPEEVHSGSRVQLVHLKCDKGHSFTKKPNDYNRQKSLSLNCPHCKGKTKTFIELAPYMMKYWDREKNSSNGIFPDKITSGSKQYIYFKCDKGHVTKRQPKSFLNKKSEVFFCPVCTGQEVTEETRLDLKYPEIAKEWHPTKNKVSPSEVSYLSNKKYWWKCEHNHEWEDGISDRTGHRYKNKIEKPCPYCFKNNVSTNETIIYTELHQFFNNVEAGYKIHGKDLDIFIEDLNLCVEYDGHKWHKEKVVKDKERNELLKSNGITTIRVRENTLPKIEDNDIEYDYVNEDIFYAIKGVVSFILENYKLEKELFELLNKYIEKEEVNNIEFYRQVRDTQRIKRIENEILFKDYDEAKNPTPLHYYGQGSDYIAHWKCHKCGHQYKKSIGGKNDYPNCPSCSRKSKIGIKGYKQDPKISKNPFRFKYPEVYNMWSDKNEDNPDFYAPSYTGKKSIWKCQQCNKEFKKEIRQMVLTYGSCTKCKRYNIGDNKGDHISKHRGHNKN